MAVLLPREGMVARVPATRIVVCPLTSWHNGQNMARANPVLLEVTPVES
jgi:hypothetical protein